MKIPGTILAFFFALLVFPQDQKVYFHNALATRISEYNQKVDHAVMLGDEDRVNFLFDSIFSNHLKNTYIEELTFNKTNGGSLRTEKLNLPFVIITKSSSLQQNVKEVEVINNISDRYKKQIRFIVLFYGDKKASAKLGKAYNNNVTVCYLDEKQNENDMMVSTYKHAFGVPSCFFISQNKQISYIDRNFNMISLNPDINSIESTNKHLALLLFKEENVQNGLLSERPTPENPGF